LILPADATIKREGEPGKLIINMEKSLEFAGHPPEKVVRCVSWPNKALHLTGPA
jgi:hypothetical protein